jgi:hypothetical protein
MTMYSFDGAPAAVRELLARSRNKRRDPEDVLTDLAKLGVNPNLQIMYLRDGLGLTLEEAKRVVTSGDKQDHAWVEDVGRAISEAVRDDDTIRTVGDNE